MGRYGFFTVVGLIITFIIYNTIHFGVFQSVEVSEAAKGPYFLVYKEHLGPYHETVDAIQDVERWAQVAGIKCHDSFGEYLDNPSVVEQERLKSNGGCLLTAAPKLEIPKDLKIKTLPEQKYVVATFAGSPALGPYKVYGKAASYIQEHRMTSTSPGVIEIYHLNEDKKSMTTTYLFSVKQ